MVAVEIVVGFALVLGYFVALLAMEGRLEAARRKDAPPVPGWNWGRFLYLTDPANLRPGSEALVRRYRLLWCAWPAALALGVLGYCFAPG